MDNSNCYVIFTSWCVFLRLQRCACLSTGQHSYKEHGNRMLLIWLHGEELAQRSPAKELYQGLILTGNRKAAGILSYPPSFLKQRYCGIYKNVAVLPLDWCQSLIQKIWLCLTDKIRMEEENASSKSCSISLEWTLNIQTTWTPHLHHVKLRKQ